MRVERFRGSHEENAPPDLKTHEEDRTWRWVASEEGRPVATAILHTRPDQRRFLQFDGAKEARATLAAAAAEVAGDVYVSCAGDEEALYRSIGFVTEIEWDEFEVSFHAALASLRAAHPARRVTLLPARHVDPQRLFALDNAVRSRVPGTDNWEGNWAWFEDELTDPAAYLVAVDRTTGDYCGLARIWRNAGGPRFGLIGVTAGSDRRVGPYLLRCVLEQAATWGYPAFTAETATSNRWIHGRLGKLSARRLGTRFQMVHRA
ncbi:MAG: hypothetical protein QNJ81_04635 [Acidimicrobiia bacterium]|nr:hypothetical protein [Acidimicrobiia bacterium]